jgi:D-glycero-alpha-D-manno-heptose 1-phosphate guanylyltransferase
VSFQAIILAGGLGTRLAPVIGDVPKGLAPIAGRPFLDRMLERLIGADVGHIIIATGHLAGQIESRFGPNYSGASIRYSREEMPLGTGGATWKALGLAEARPCFVFNGDTIAELDLARMMAQHEEVAADVTLAAYLAPDASRFGRLHIEDGLVTRFDAKGAPGPGPINAGVYLMAPEIRNRFLMPAAFSLERDFFTARLPQLRISAFSGVTSFLDIGVPGDYALAQRLEERKA